MYRQRLAFAWIACFAVLFNMLAMPMTGAMAQAAKQALGAEALTALADTGYYNAETLKACEAEAITAFVPPPDRSQRLKAQGRFSLEDFRYDAADDLYRCPAGEALRPMQGLKRQAGGKLAIRYASRRADCRVCPLRQRCLARRGNRREIERWVHEDVIERHRARMQAGGESMMRRRKALAEHPFGTLKCRAGYRHFLVRGFDKVRGEWSLMALCYNFTRLLNILGLDKFRACLAMRRTNWPNLLRQTIRGVIRRLPTSLARALTQISRNAPAVQSRFSHAI